MEVRYRVNLDFDMALSRNDITFQNEKFLKELEYIFLLVNQDSNSILCSKNNYSQQYLKQLTSLGFTMPNFDSNICDYLNWWGDLESFEEVRLTNSKCALAKWHSPLQDKVIHKEADLEALFPSFYRPDQSFSGIGNKKLNSRNDFKALKYPGVQSQFVEVKYTFGITYNFSTNEFFVVSNLTGSKGEFKGGKLIELSDLPVEFDLSEVINKLKKHTPAKCQKGEIQFDNMIYLKDGELHLCPIVEINYRRTMGAVIKSVTGVLGPGILHFGDKSSLNENSIILSPSFVKNICYFNRA